MFFMAKPLVSHTFLCPQLALTTMQLPTKYFEDFALFEVPDDSSRPGQPPFAVIVSTLNKHPSTLFEQNRGQTKCGDSPLADEPGPRVHLARVGEHGIPVR